MGIQDIGLWILKKDKSTPFISKLISQSLSISKKLKYFQALDCKYSLTVYYCIKYTLSEKETLSKSKTGSEKLSKSTCWSDSSYILLVEHTYFVEWGEAVTVCAPHRHNALKNQYCTGGEMCDGPCCLLQNDSKQRESADRGLAKKYSSRGSSNDYLRE